MFHRFLNIKRLPGDERSLTVKLQLQQQLPGQEWSNITDPKLEPGTPNMSLPLADGQTAFGPICIQEGSGSVEGRYGLRVSLLGAAPLGLSPFRVMFDLANASATSIAVKEAKDAFITAKGQLKAAEVQLKQKKTVFERRQTDLDRKLLSIRQHLPSDLPLSADNVSDVRDACQDHLAALPGQRPPRSVGQPTGEHRQQLLAFPGVVGFVSDLVLVTDEEDARLLSFSAGRKLQTLLVTDHAVSVAVRKHLQGNAYKPPILSLDLASTLPQELHVPFCGMFSHGL